MYHLLPSSVMNSGYAGTPSLATSPGWVSRQPQGGGRGGGGGGGATRERRRVTIFRNSLDTPWGFRVQGGKDLNAPLSVKRVFSGSPADGRLTREDLILAIDDQPVDGLSSAQVSEAIGSAGTSMVLTIETSPYDSAFDNSFEPIRNAVQHQQPKQVPVQQSQPKKHETKTSDYGHSFLSSPSANYETSPPDTSRQTSSAALYSKAATTAKGHHRPANRFQATSAAPYGLSEPGWSPKSKPAAKEPPTATAREPPPPPPTVPEAPVSQHRSARQQHAKPPGSGGGGDAGWRSQYAAVDDPRDPAWYGSLRSNRAAHQWEVRAAAKEAQSPTALQNVSTEPVSQRDTRRQPEQTTESQQSRTYKAEVRGLMLARPAYHQAQSTPAEWEDAPGRGGHDLYHTPGQARSAPETPTADTCGRTICSDVQTAAPQAAAYSQSQQQVDGSAPVKIQPSLLFGNRSAAKTVQLPSQTRVPVRTQPQEIKVTPNVGQPRQEVRASGFQLAMTHKEPPAVPVFKVPAATQAPTATRIVSAPQARATETARSVPSSLTPVTVVKPVEEPPKAAPKVLPTVHAESVTPVKTVERFNLVPDTSQIENLIQAQVRPSSQIEPYAPTSDRLQKTTGKPASESSVKFTQTPVERFNPTPDKREKLTQPSVLHSQVKSQTTLVERFNPTPDKGEKPTQLPVSYSQVKSQPLVVERFNPTPDKQEKPTKQPVSYSQVKSQATLVERFNPTPDKGGKPTQSPVSYSQVKSQPLAVERFNPTPDKQEKSTKQPVSYSQVKSQAVERFNPTPDKGERPTQLPVSYSQVKSQPLAVERFNPTPDKQEKPLKALGALSPPKSPSAPLESTSQQPARLAKSTVLSAPLKVSLTPIERFNPTPDRPQNIPRATATHISKNILQPPLERFNPTPDPPPKVPQRQIERFNPVPDRP